MWWRVFSVLLLLLSQSGCEQQQLAATSHPTATPQLAAPPLQQKLKQQFQQELYIWQRVWTDEHQQALEQSRPHFSVLRILALQYMATAQGPLWHQADVNLALLKKDGRPVTLVLRLDGQIPKLPLQSLTEKLQPILALYQQAGIQLAGIEIDYDCARSQLAAYRLWLTKFRAALPKDIPVSMTALPDWLQSAEFGPLTAQVSQVTMQLHAVLSPEQGLFAPELAKKWAIAAAAQSQSPLYFALPAYHSALITAASNKKTAQSSTAVQQYWVESEVPLDIKGERRELRVDPLLVQQWLFWLQQQQFARVKGIVWFRLPLPSDQRSWAYATLAAVASGQPLKADLRLRLQKTPTGFDLIAENYGNLALLFATPIRLKAHNCTGADALAGFALSQQQQEYQLAPTTAVQPLAVNSTRTLAWFNCQKLQLLAET
ncbi:DUF3142 domain-containing protein [Rheinheimera sp.]|uniref:DUF3142 domain-containing protein n=1 Tax=Rheinheimera sp. TaxID=1869214 RepID=UPI0027B9B6EC|nr:DUF3142 domain-containing protein [Rheinheimera sp.]